MPGSHLLRALSARQRISPGTIRHRLDARAYHSTHYLSISPQVHWVISRNRAASSGVSYGERYQFSSHILPGRQSYLSPLQARTKTPSFNQFTIRRCADRTSLLWNKPSFNPIRVKSIGTCGILSTRETIHRGVRPHESPTSTCGRSSSGQDHETHRLFREIFSEGSSAEPDNSIPVALALNKKISRHHQMSTLPPWINDPNRPPWLESLVTSLDDRQNASVCQDSSKSFDELHRQLRVLSARGDLLQAMAVLLQAEHSGNFPSEEDYLALLKACARKKALVQTKEVKAHLIRHSSQLTPFLAEYLVITLVKCGAVDDAFELFQSLPQRTIFSWTAIITAYADCGKGDKAFDTYQSMLAKGVQPNEFTYVSLLKACGSMKNLKVGKDLHADVKEKGFLSDIFVGSTLVSMYGKCGDIMEAENVFANLTHPNVVSWNAMLSAYVDQGLAEKALKLFDRMKKEGVSPKEATYVIALQACSLLADEEEAVVVEGKTMKEESLRTGKALHSEIKRRGFQSHPFICSSLVSMYGKCGGIKEAECVFLGLSHHDVVSWTSILAAYVVQGQGGRVLELYKQMQTQGTRPDEQTLVMALQGCCLCAEKEAVLALDGQAVRKNSLRIGRSLHADARRWCFDSNVFVASALVMMYGKCGDISEAESVFSHLTHPDNVAWNSMFSAYIDQGQGEKAIKLFRRMHERGACVDDVTLVCMLQACSEVGDLEACEKVHFSIVSAGCQLGPVLSCLLHAYGSCAGIADAQAVFGALSRPDDVIWSTLIAAVCREGNSFVGFLSFQAMQLAGIDPDRVTYLSLLSTCSHDGLVDVGVEFFDLMSKEYGLPLEVKHFVTLFDLLGRAGDFKRLGWIMSKMHVQADVAVWLSFLAACRNHGNVEMGKIAFDCAVQLQPKEAAAYVLMANIYVDAGMYDFASKVDMSRQAVGAWESPYQSWLEESP